MRVYGQANDFARKKKEEEEEEKGRKCKTIFSFFFFLSRSLFPADLSRFENHERETFLWKKRKKNGFISCRRRRVY